MPSEQVAAVKALYDSWTQNRINQPHRSVAEQREENEHWQDLTAEPGGVDYIEVDAGGVPAMWVIPKGATEDRVILAIHGGGFVGGSMYTHRKLFGHLAKAVGAKALLPNYRLTPEHQHPAPLDDTSTVYKWLLDQGIEGKHIALTGDSAGGGLSVTTMLRARDEGLPLAAGLMLISPWVDMEVIGETMVSNRETDGYYYQEVTQFLVKVFLGENGDPKDPSVNPLYADLTNLPPLYIQVGGAETLLDDSRRLAALAEKAGVEVQLDVFDELLHTFHITAGRAPEADDAIQRFAAWVRPKLGLI